MLKCEEFETPGPVWPAEAWVGPAIKGAANWEFNKRVPANLEGTSPRTLEIGGVNGRQNHLQLLPGGYPHGSFFKLFIEGTTWRKPKSATASSGPANSRKGGQGYPEGQRGFQGRC